MEKDLKHITGAISELVKSRNELANLALVQYTPVVDQIISSKSKDNNYIERTLDWILDFGFDDNMLLLYKKLCRYYATINEAGTISYINFYREMWDNEDDSPEIEN